MTEAFFSHTAIGFVFDPTILSVTRIVAAVVFAEMYLDLRSQDLTVSQHLRNLVITDIVESLARVV